MTLTHRSTDYLPPTHRMPLPSPLNRSLSLSPQAIRFEEQRLRPLCEAATAQAAAAAEAKERARRTVVDLERELVATTAELAREEVDVGELQPAMAALRVSCFLSFLLPCCLAFFRAFHPSDNPTNASTSHRSLLLSMHHWTPPVSQDELSAAEADARNWPAKRATLISRLAELPLLLQDNEEEGSDQDSKAAAEQRAA